MKLEYKRFEQINKFKWWHFSLIVAPILIYYYWIKLFGVNCPQLDDFGVLLNLVEVGNASTYKEKLHLVFSPHNEHRIIFTKLIFGLISLTDNGAIDIYKVLFLGNITLLGVAFIFYRAIIQIKQSWVYAFAISCMLFQMQYFENTFFGMAAVQNLGIYFWLGLSFWKLTQVAKQPKQLLWAFVWGFFATFTSGNGLVVFPAGIFILWFLEAKKMIIPWVLYGLIITGLYLHNLPHQNSINNFVQLFEGSMGYLGGFVGTTISAQVPILLGVLMLFVGVLLNLNLVFVKQIPLHVRSKQVQVFLLAFFIALVATSCMVGLNRDIISAISTPRYKIGSAVFVCLITLMIANIQMNPRFSFLIGVGFAFAFSLFCLMTYYKMTPVVKANRAVYQNNIDAFKRKVTGQEHPPILFEKEWYEVWKAGKWDFPENKN